MISNRTELLQAIEPEMNRIPETNNPKFNFGGTISSQICFWLQFYLVTCNYKITFITINGIVLVKFINVNIKLTDLAC